MIPKSIHCIWLSGERKPRLLRECISTWKRVLPEYTIHEWGLRDFDFQDMPIFVQRALKEKKWAYVTDYLRLYVVEKHGGIYMDADVLIRKRIDAFLNCDFFSFVEYHESAFLQYADRIDADGKPKTDAHIPGLCIQAAFFGAASGNIFLEKCMSMYENAKNVLPDGSYANGMIAPDLYGLCAREFGFLYKDTYQELERACVLYPSNFVAGCFKEMKPENYAIHCCAGSWRKRSAPRKLYSKLHQLYASFVLIR